MSDSWESDPPQVPLPMPPLYMPAPPAPPPLLLPQSPLSSTTTDHITPPPRVWPAFVAFIAFFGSTVVFSIIAFAVWMIFHGVGGGPQQVQQSVEQAITSRSFNMVNLLVTVCIGVGIAIGGARLSPRGTRERLSWLTSRARWIALPVLVLGTMGVSVALGLVIGLFHMNETGTLKLLRAMFENLRGWPLAGMVALVGLGAGVAEELLFRGYIQTRLVQRMGPAWGIIITSVLFAIAHFDVAHSTFALGFGLYLGWMTWVFKSIRPAMLCHVVNNCEAVLAGAYGDPSEHVHQAGPFVTWMTIALAVLIACTLIAPRLKTTAD